MVSHSDSGVDFSHPDLQGTAAYDKEGRILARDFTDTDLVDTLGHGTAVAGMIASQGRRTYRIEEPGMAPALLRIQGVAPGVRLMSAKVFDTRVPGMGGWESSMACGTKRQSPSGARQGRTGACPVFTLPGISVRWSAPLGKIYRHC